jgi:hypothetical protein
MEKTNSESGEKSKSSGQMREALEDDIEFFRKSLKTESEFWGVASIKNCLNMLEIIACQARSIDRMEQLRISSELKRKVSLSSDGEMKILRERRRVLHELTMYLPAGEEERGFFQKLLPKRSRGSTPPIDPNSFEGLKMRAKESLNACGIYNIKWECDNCYIFFCEFSRWTWFREQYALAKKARAEAPPEDEGAEKRFQEFRNRLFAVFQKDRAKRERKMTET